MLAIEQRYWRGVRVVGASIIADSLLGKSLGKPQRDFGGLAPTLIAKNREKQRMEVEGRQRQLANLKPFQPGVSRAIPTGDQPVAALGSVRAF